MPSVCFYFQVHQPFRLRNLSYFEKSVELSYFDEQKNREVMQKVATKCYLPTNKTMLELIERHQGKFKIAYSISGVAIEQMEKYAPEVLESFKKLARTGCVEFIGETYYHSLAAVYNEQEFRQQVASHSRLIKELFGQTPRVFRNTELVYDDNIGSLVADLGYKAMLAEGADDILDWRSPNFVYKHPGNSLKLLLKNYRLSDDVAFRFSNRGWECYPLTADRYASWIHSVSGNGDLVNLFMDYETFGEHQWADSGIFEFLKHLPTEIFKHPDWGFCTPSEAVDKYSPISEIGFFRLTSWADVGRDLTAWNGNSIQKSALKQVYELGQEVLEAQDGELVQVWRKLLTSDHFYYMCTKWFADGDVHAYFSPYDSPYEAFINFMNVLKNFREYVAKRKVERLSFEKKSRNSPGYSRKNQNQHSPQQPE